MKTSEYYLQTYNIFRLIWVTTVLQGRIGKSGLVDITGKDVDRDVDWRIIRFSIGNQETFLLRPPSHGVRRTFYAKVHLDSYSNSQVQSVITLWEGKL